MLIKKFEGETPKIDPKAFVAETAVVIGKAELKEYSSVWYNVTIRGDVNEIKVGRYTNVQDNSVQQRAARFRQPCLHSGRLCNRRPLRTSARLHG